MKKQIKLIASTLVFTTLLTANTFAISNNSKNESIFDNNKVGTFYFKDSAKAMNNPFSMKLNKTLGHIKEVKE